MPINITADRNRRRALGRHRHGRPRERRGPFRDADEAEAMARQVAGICRALFHSGMHIHRARSGMPANRPAARRPD